MIYCSSSLIFFNVLDETETLCSSYNDRCVGEISKPFGGVLLLPSELVSAIVYHQKRLDFELVTVSHFFVRKLESDTGIPETFMAFYNLSYAVDIDFILQCGVNGLYISCLEVGLLFVFRCQQTQQRL